MENIDNMAKNSLDSFMKDNLTSKEQSKIKGDIIRGVISLSCLCVGLLYGMIFKNDIVPGIFYTIGFLTEGIPVVITAVNGIRSKEFKNAMEMLVAIAIVACFCTGELVLSILIPLILNIAHFLEERSIIGGREVIDGLRKMSHDTAVLYEDGKEQTVSAKTLKKGQVIIVKPGSGIPIDGVVTSGDTHIDQKSLTGEPEPAYVTTGENVYAGTVNIDGQITVRVEKEYVDTSFSKILSLLEESENIETSQSRLIDRFMRYYIPLILVIATAVALFTRDISKAIAILVVSCPCGQMLVSSAPMIAALSAAIRRGILIKNSKFIEELTEIDSVVFDKTGTITTGELSLCCVTPIDGTDKKLLLDTAVSVASSSNHPISRALSGCGSAEAVQERFDVKEHAGKGIEGISKDGSKRILFGNRSLLASFDIEIPDGFGDSETASVSYVTLNGTLLGFLGFSDTVRDNAGLCMTELKELGAEKIVVLTGDRQASADAVTEKMEIDEVKAQLLPLDKLEAVRQIKEDNFVLCIGDGINDALSLREADVGIAMGAMGSDLAIQSADIALMNNNLRNIPFVIRLARKTQSIIYQNLVLSCIVSFSMILLSSFGIISALMGAVLHNIGAFAVLINSSRILQSE
ncbi:MAG: cation-translocating P-type ATPase [Clostridia bacterium]|nr:cation-translocating P-type ATPase [Clostridia bacterium]